MTKRDPQSPRAVMHSDHAMQRGPDHAYALGQCKRCKAERPVWVFVAPDPADRGWTRAVALAQAWEATHPCGGLPTKSTRVGTRQ